MKQVFFLAFVCLIVYQIDAKELNVLERRLRDLTEAEPATVAKRDACSVQFVKVGCYNDKKSSRAMNEMLFSDRGGSGSKFSGTSIDWGNFGPYLDDLACRCAKAANALGYTHFGAQFYGECWSSSNAGDNYNTYGSTDKCVDANYQTCTAEDDRCVGKKNANFVYQIAGEGSGGSGGGEML